MSTSVIRIKARAFLRSRAKLISNLHAVYACMCMYTWAMNTKYLDMRRKVNVARVRNPLAVNIPDIVETRSHPFSIHGYSYKNCTQRGAKRAACSGNNVPTEFWITMQFDLRITCIFEYPADSGRQKWRSKFLGNGPRISCHSARVHTNTHLVFGRKIAQFEQYLRH